MESGWSACCLDGLEVNFVVPIGSSDPGAFIGRNLSEADALRDQIERAVAKPERYPASTNEFDLADAGRK
jgi:hypothetical protein